MPNHRWAFAAAGLLLCVSGSGVWASAGASLRAGMPYAIDVWRTDQGLPQNSVIAMTQTRDGYLWLGTLNGLVRFDGLHFTVFDENNTPGLNSSEIVYLFEDSEGNLWAGTRAAGVALIKDGQCVTLDIGRGSREGRLMAACEDRNGAVWLYTKDGQLWRHWKGKRDVWYPPGNRFSTCRALIADPSGLIWVGMDQDLFAFDPATMPNSSALAPKQLQPPQQKLDFLLPGQRGGQWRLMDGRIKHWTTNGVERNWAVYPWTNGVTVTAACEDGQGNLVVGTLEAGLFWFDANGKATSISTNEGLSNNSILSLHADREGSLWVGTDGGGLNRVKRPVFDALEASLGSTVQSVCEDGEGGLWMGFNMIGPNA